MLPNRRTAINVRKNYDIWLLWMRKNNSIKKNSGNYASSTYTFRFIKLERRLAIDFSYRIIEGLYTNTIEKRINYCDTIIYMDFSRWVCLYNVIKRVIKNYGKSRNGMPANCPEKFDYKFLKCIWNYNKKYRKKYLSMLKNIDNKNVFILRNRKECQHLIYKIK